MSLRPCNEKNASELGFPRHGSLAFSSASSWDATFVGVHGIMTSQDIRKTWGFQVEKTTENHNDKRRITTIYTQGIHLQRVGFSIVNWVFPTTGPNCFQQGKDPASRPSHRVSQSHKGWAAITLPLKKKTVFGWQIKEIVMKRLSCDSHTLTVVKILGWLMRESWWNGFLWLPYTYYKLGSISQLFEVELSWLITSQLMGD